MEDRAQVTPEMGTSQALDVNSAADLIRQLQDPEQPPLEAQEDAPEQDVEEDAPEQAQAEDAESPEPQEPQASETEQTEEQEATEESEKPPQKYTVKIDGEEQEVTLEEALKGYQREADYTRKTMALAEQRKALEQRQAETFETAKQRLEEVAAMGQFLEQQLVAEYQSVNWEELRETDPGEFAARRQMMGEQAQRIQQIKMNAGMHAETLKQQQQQAFAEKYPEILKQQEEMLVSKLPEWRENKAERQKELRQYLTANGYNDDEASAIADHRFVVMADKARRYDLMQSAKPQTKKVLKEPTKVLKPGPKQTKSQQQRDRFTAQFKDFQAGGGRVDQAAKLISLLQE